MGRSDLKFLASRIQPGANIVDVGANIGLYTLWFSRLAGPSGRVLSLEPHPILVQNLIFNIQHNEAINVDVFELAAGSKKCRLRLDTNPFNSGDNRLQHGFVGTTEEIIRVEVVPLDLLLAGRRVDWIKIDVQGWEPAVISGLAETIERNPQLELFFEFCSSDMAKAGFVAQEFIEDLLSMGFILATPQNGPMKNSEIALLGRRRGYLNLHAKRKK